MECFDCINFLEAYIDGEAGEREAEQVRLHLATCANCETQFEALTAEQEMYARYDRELQISPALWNGIAARIAPEDREIAAGRKFDVRVWFAGLFSVPAFRLAMPAMAMVLIALVVGLAYWRTQTRPQPPVLTAGMERPAPAASNSKPAVGTSVNTPLEAAPLVNTGGGSRNEQPGTPTIVAHLNRPATNQRADNGSDVLFRDAAYADPEERDTASHLEQAQNLLISFRNIKYSDDDEEVDVTYEKAESRRLLNENVLLRRDAEVAGKYPAKAMLGSLEPFLIDIANLPDKAKPADIRQLTDRVQRTEIVAELRGY